MKPNYLITLLFFFFFITSQLISQDLIITIDVGIKVENGKILKIEDGIVFFTEKQNDKLLEIDIETVSSISFSDTNDILVYPVVEYDTINCEITKIGHNIIEYSIFGSDLGRTIEKYKVFACIFENSPSSEKLKYYRSIYNGFNLVFVVERKAKLTRTNGKKYRVIIDSLIDDRIYLKTIEKKYVINSSISREEVNTIYLADFYLNPNISYTYDFILTQNHSFLTGEVLSIDSDSLFFRHKSTNTSTKVKSAKSSISAIFFTNMEDDNPKSSQSLDFTKSNTHANDFFISGGYGRYMNNIAETNDKEFDRLFNRLNNGFYLGIGASHYFNKKFSVGGTGRLFLSSSESDITFGPLQVVNVSIKWYSMFIGATANYKQKLGRHLSIQLSASPGVMIYKSVTVFAKDKDTKNVVLAYGPSFTLAARTYLMSGSGGKIFLEAAYSRSAFNKYSVDKKKYELDETDPMPQYYLGIGLAF